MERIQKVIANSGYCSRRKAEELIEKGKVSVNGETVKEMGFKVSNDDVIMVEGKILDDPNKEYYVLNKPRGVISSVKDEHDRKTVVDFIDTISRIYPVGRLDYDTTGLIILTNDGDLANFLMHPSNNIEKTYVAKIEGILSMEEYHKLKKGIKIDNYKTIPKRLKKRKKDVKSNTEIIEITLVEGRNHIVKKLFEVLGHQVIKLKRERYAFLDIVDLKSGEYRMLSSKEVKQLKALKTQE